VGAGSTTYLKRKEGERKDNKGGRGFYTGIRDFGVSVKQSPVHGKSEREGAKGDTKKITKIWLRNERHCDSQSRKPLEGTVRHIWQKGATVEEEWTRWNGRKKKVLTHEDLHQEKGTEGLGEKKHGRGEPQIGLSRRIRLLLRLLGRSAFYGKVKRGALLGRLKGRHGPIFKKGEVGASDLKERMTGSTEDGDRSVKTGVEKSSGAAKRGGDSTTRDG